MTKYFAEIDDVRRRIHGYTLEAKRALLLGQKDKLKTLIENIEKLTKGE